jgi:nucleoid-associated protein YgaU
MSNINEVASPSPLAAAIGRALAKPSITFVERSSDDNLATISGRILAGMTANTAYPAPVPTLVTLTTARAAFVAAVNANDRGRIAIAGRDKARSQLGQVLRDLALYVQQQSNGDLVTVLSSGYPAQRTRGAAVQTAPGAPTGIRLQQGRLSGQIAGLCDRVAGAMLYQWRFATAQAPTVYTQTDTASKARVTFANLVPGTQYLVQVRACGKRGSSDWSNAVTVYAV